MSKLVDFTQTVGPVTTKFTIRSENIIRIEPSSADANKTLIYYLEQSVAAGAPIGMSVTHATVDTTFEGTLNKLNVAT